MVDYLGVGVVVKVNPNKWFKRSKSGSGILTYLQKGETVKDIEIGDVVGIKWLNSSCMSCEFCTCSSPTILFMSNLGLIPVQASVGTSHSAPNQLYQDIL